MPRARRLVTWLLVACWPTALRAQNLGGGGDGPDISAARMVAAVLICVAAAFALAFAVRGRGKSAVSSRRHWLSGAIAGSRRIEVVEARRLSSFADICLIRCDGTEYLLVCGASGQQVLRRSSLSADAE